jgi:hypothetical protein
MATVPHSDEELVRAKTFARTGSATLSQIGGKAALTLAGRTADTLGVSGVLAARDARVSGQETRSRRAMRPAPS